MGTIHENTKVTVGVVIALLSGAVWLTTVHVQGLANAAAIEDIKSAQVSKEDKDEILRTDVAVIKAQVIQINKKMDDQ